MSTLEKSSIKKTLRLVLFIVAGASASFLVADRARAGQANQFQILTGFSAKETCSCAFLVEQTDAYCTAFGEVGGFTVDIAIDRSAKTATTTFAGSSRTAHFTEGEGCLLDPLP